MSSAPAPLARFTAAMQSVYGTLPSDFEEAKSWTPPSMSDGFKGRYLWTDAFGVVNFITLSRESQDDRYLTLAESLVETVHNIQGHTRDGRSRLPGATDDNPLGGGLRIGKEDEGGPDGDGQYHHYLTLWMFALNRLSVATKDTKFNDQAIALAKAIHPHFFVGKDTASPRMVWKISTDMSTILVSSEGNLDPIDGHVIMRILQAHDRSRVLDREINDYKKIMDRKGKHFASDDTLDLGMTLWTSHWMADSEKWATDLQRSCITQLNRLFADDGYRVSDMRFRLAFRDFGACLGINISQDADSVLRKHASELIRLWEQRAGKTPGKLRPITEVMHAAALIPGAFKKGYLGPEPDF